jgi:Spy/CpxP family protein refolding chaperone
MIICSTGLNLRVHMKYALMAILMTLGGVLTAQTKYPADRDRLLAGTPENEAALVEASGFPTPERILSFNDQLGLTKDQLKKIDAIVKELPVTLKVKGEEIVEAEDELLKFLQTGAPNERNVRTRLERIGKLRAEIRFAHIQVHLKIKALLTTNQFDRYKELVSTTAK